jgi:hypothetical protein
MLSRIFRIIERDEADHWEPYEGWLDRHGMPRACWWERAVDRLIHLELLWVKLQILFVTPWLSRRVDWADANEGDDIGSPALATG